LVDPNKFFASVNRISLIPHLEKQQTIEEFANSIHIETDKSYLFIVNTIKCAKELYEEMKNLNPNEDIQYITSHIIPKQRLERIHLLQEHKSRIAITTQLIEAGVDIDFDIVYRDIAPLDSINQACGRCNRNAKQHGETHVIHLANEDGKSYSSFVYDHILLEQTNDLLQSHQSIEESLFQSMLKSYYKRVRRRISSDTSNAIESAIQKLIYCSEDNCEPAVNNFKLISSYEKFSVFIEIDEDASNVWNEYEAIFKITDKFKRRSAFDEIKADFSKYQIAISINSENLPPENHGLRFVSFHQLDQYYDHITGYKTQNNDAMIW
jgi:CRISPR-associated endonuclease/helicase Cas3